MSKWASCAEFHAELNKYPEIAKWLGDNRTIFIPERVYVGMTKEVTNFLKHADAAQGMADKSRGWYWSMTFEMGVAEGYNHYTKPDGVDEFTDEDGCLRQERMAVRERKRMIQNHQE